MSGDAGTWLGVIALAGAAAAAAAAVPRALWRLDRQRRHEDSAAQARAADREAMLSRVRDKWIDGILQPSLAHTERLTLDLIHDGEHTRAPVLQMFLRTGGGLLIRGAPGGGKTTLLLELADGLLERAESDPAQPVPVVASLATWSGKRQPLTAWLAAELAASYRIPPAAAHAWAHQDDLVLLLDGLDEVPGRYRDSCAEAINRFLRERPFCRMAVCCRSGPAGQLDTELMLPQTVELRPAAREQVDSYLARLETTWTPLAGIRAAIAADERLRVPLMLKVAALADRGRTPPARRELASPTPMLPAPELPREIAEIFAPQPPSPIAGNGPGPASGSRPVSLDPAAIWDAYLTRMLSQRPLSPAREYDQVAARRSLAWLASWLRDSGETEFDLDQLASGTRPQSPPQPHHRPGAHTRARELRRALRQAATRTDRHIQTILLDLARWLESRTATRNTGIANVLRDRAATARPGAWLRHLPGAMTRPAEESGWSPERVPSFRPALMAVLLLPALVAASAAIGGWVLATIAALACGLLWGLNLPGRIGMVPRPRRRRTVPNERIRRSARQAAATATAAALASGLGLYLVSRLFGALSMPAVVLAAIAAGAGASVSNGAGACARHYAARYRLARAGVLPWRCMSFLDSMTGRGLLYRSGSGYRFIHRLLADHLAAAGGPGQFSSAHIPINPIEKMENSSRGLANPEVIPVALSHEPAYRADQPSSQRVSHRAQQPAGRHSARTG